ncbi:hypothetical protein EVAR_2731_1 [Eumeta japonica]|uniref:Mos1 transposase HTH domain-containing protein n=1 Tax=Eumeta variegata TaxID=151549 RepID=A0A4C1SZB4_EUMVA|nr:hypothetical protein EVAR_2731_1 [Eumeta japonica]
MIFYDFKCNLKAQQRLTWLRTTFGNEASRKTTIYNWFAEFKRGRVNFSDEFRDGPLSTTMYDKNINAVLRMIDTNSRTEYMDTVALADRRIMNCDWYTTIYLPERARVQEVHFRLAPYSPPSSHSPTISPSPSINLFSPKDQQRTGAVRSLVRRGVVSLLGCRGRGAELGPVMTSPRELLNYVTELELRFELNILDSKRDACVIPSNGRCSTAKRFSRCEATRTLAELLGVECFKVYKICSST